MPQDHTERARRAGSGSRGGGPGTLYNLYRSELGRISRCTPEEEGELLKALLAGEEGASERLVEGRLEMAALLAEDYKGRGLPVDDLVQEANMGLLLAVREYQGGDFGEIFCRAAEAAQKGVEETKRYAAKFGRAKSLMERSIGYQDAGATSVWIIFRAAADWCLKKEAEEA